MQVSQQLPEEVESTKDGMEVSWSVQEESSANATGYWKEGWESQIAALKVELAQLRFENESLSLQLRNLQNIQKRLSSSNFVQSEESCTKSGTNKANRTVSNTQHEYFVDSSFRNKNKSVKQDPEREQNSIESNAEKKDNFLETRTVSCQVSVEFVGADNQRAKELVQGTLSHCNDSLIFKPFEAGVTFPYWKPNAESSFEKKLRDISEISFSNRILKDANVSVPMGLIFVREERDLVFVGLERPMEYVYLSTQEWLSSMKTAHSGNPRARFTPQLLQKSSILRSNDLALLSSCMPRRYQNCNWTLLYSTNVHGISIHTFYNRVSDKSPTLLVIKNTDGDCFGCYASLPWKPSLHYYGTGECFVFSLFPEYHVYRWSSENHSFQLSSMDFIAIGGGKHFAIWIDADFVSGTCGDCETFHNPTLCSHEEFTCHVLEVWYPIPY